VVHNMKSILCVLVFWTANKMQRCPDEGENVFKLMIKWITVLSVYEDASVFLLFKSLCLHKAFLSLWQLICYPL
jgi:hypothetical protein